MAFVSLYRKYRSQTFGDLVGQGHVVRTLQNAIGSGRMSHAYLFTGPRGTGKTSTARLLAKALCCEKGPAAEPCNECDVCVSITTNTSLDVVEIDAASESGVEEVREKIVDRADYQPSVARYRIYIIDEVHDLSPKAFDALLKTIEEPPAHLVFILATTEFNKVPRTIQSRCQKFEFHRGSVADLVSRLEYVAKEEGFEIEPAALAAIARMADGGFRDALTLLEQAALTAEGTITIGHVYRQFGWVDDALSDAILLALANRDIPKLLTTLEEIFGTGRDPRSVVESLIYRLATLTSAVYGVADGAADPTQEAAIHESAVRIGPDRLLTLRGKLADAHRTLRDISLPRLWLESELLSWTLPEASPKTVSAVAPEGVKPAASAEPQMAVVTEQKPAAKPSAPTVKKESESRPAVDHPAPTATGDPALDRARQVWHQTVLELGSMSKTMAMKLASTEVASIEGMKVEVRFQREIERDAILEGNKAEQRKQAILDQMRKLAGEPWEIVYTVGPRTNGSASAPAVELPVEGERLVEMAKEVLGGM